MQAVEAACTKNAIEPVLLDVSEVCSYTDYILVLSGRSMRQVEAIAEALEGGLKQHGHDPLGREGGRGGQWTLLDFGDLVVHIFYDPVREYYDIEGLWAEAKREKLDLPPEFHARAAGGYAW